MANARWSSGRQVRYDSDQNVDLETLMTDENIQRMRLAVLDINYKSEKKEDTVCMSCQKAAIYDINEDSVVNGPNKSITVEDLARYLGEYDVVFFKGGMVEVAFVRRFVGDDVQLVNMESLGCPTYDQLVSNSNFMTATELKEDPKTCASHKEQQNAMHCATSEVSVFGKWLLLEEQEREELQVERCYIKGQPNPKCLFAFFPMKTPTAMTAMSAKDDSKETESSSQIKSSQSETSSSTC